MLKWATLGERYNEQPRLLPNLSWNNSSAANSLDLLTMRAIAIDPGGSTGLAWTMDGRTIKTQTLGPEPHHLELYDELVMFQPDVICIEKFIWQPRAYTQLISVEYIGVVHMFQQMGNVEVVERAPHQVKTLFDNDKLKQWDLYKGHSNHERDAIRHLLAYLIIDCKRNEWLEKLRP